MEQVAHQTIVMQFILELAKSLKVDPRGCFRQFFEKIKVRNEPSKIHIHLVHSPVSIPFSSDNQCK